MQTTPSVRLGRAAPAVFARPLEPLLLLMDPDPDARKIGRVALEAAGFRVEVAENGEECLRLVPRVGPDALITELFGARLDGFDVAARPRASPDWARLKLVALTTCALPRYRKRALREGFARYLIKPVEPRRLVREVEALIGTAHGRATGSGRG